MKKFGMILSLAGVMAAPNLFAAMNVTLLDNGYYNNNPDNAYSQGVGGEFRAVGDAGLDSVVNWGAYSSATTSSTQGTISDAVDNPSWGYNSGLDGQSYFQTFCIEFNEEFTPGASYTISSIGNNALYNNSPTQTPVPITMGVAYLYSQFAAGKLAGYCYTYGNGRQASAGIVQNAIWYLLGEGGSLGGFALTDLQNSGIAQANWMTAANGDYGVQAMVLGAPGTAQDQLIITGSTTDGSQNPVVPEPTTIFAAALLLLPLGASAIRILRKSKNN